MSTAAPPELVLEEAEEPLMPLLPRRQSEGDFDMDITPMIDITFLMLIFFLVASTPDDKTAVDLPTADHGVAVSQLRSVIFTVAEGGLDLAPVYNADGRVADKQLSDSLEERNQQIRQAVEQGYRENKPDVIIKAGKTVSFREVARVIKAASEVENIRIHLAVLETD